MSRLIVAFLIATITSSSFIVHFASGQSDPSCDSLIYCQGDLLDTVQMSAIFNDSKTFVDLKMLFTANETLANFASFMNETDNNPTKDQIRQFVTDNFDANTNEFDEWTPADYNANPAFLADISNVIIRDFARDLVHIWPDLARKIKQDVIDNPDQYSLIPVDNGFIIPGGRFREFYYWDSYWIVKGLLISEMHDTVKGMLNNFLSFIDRFGFIPNGARIYYLNRSQPPLFTMMVDAYLKATNDIDWLRENIDLIDQELRFWLEKKTVEVERHGRTYILAHYDSESGSPRPESYLEDVQNANYYANDDDKKQLYANLKSGAESGWDFSSRWIIDTDGGNNGNLSHVQTRRVIPVDLNSFLCKDFKLISQFYDILGDKTNKLFWLGVSQIWQNNIDKVFYDTRDGIWYDYDAELKKPRKYFYPSNFAPLWTESYVKSKSMIIAKKAVHYFLSNDIMDYHGGIPTSIIQSGEQWDFPNAWAPLQAFIIFGFEQTGNRAALKLAKVLAMRWVKANLIGYQTTNEMFEKYDAENPGQYGSGGEYTVQSGFGWTNGLALELIQYYYTTT